jgi:large subunit ribosomal protein L15
MSLLSSLRPKKGSVKRKKRLGRGDSSGHGGTSGKGHKGQLARTGGRVRRGFEGGQTPLHRRAPKFGFSNVDFATKYNVVNLTQLETMSGEVNPVTLKSSKIVRARGPIKVLGNGSLKKALTVKAHQFSEAAKKAIEAAGGKVEVIKE